MNERFEEEAVIEQLAKALDALGIQYAIGGSLASALYGAVRFTSDADITVQGFSPVADRFYELLRDSFYITREAMEDALRSHGSFNVVHFETSFKIDLFVQGPGEFDQQLLVRRRKVKLTEAGGGELCVVSPEDIILLKLRWFRETGGTSEHQWSDVQGVLGVQAGALDCAYLTHWAKELGVNELLDRAIAEART